MEGEQRLVVCNRTKYRPISVWTGPQTVVFGPTARWACPVIGCNSAVGVFQSPSTKHVYIHPHKCISSCRWLKEMKVWYDTFVRDVRYVQRVCRVCTKTPTKVAKQRTPYMHIQLFGSVLILNIKTHAITVYVNFAATNWPRDLPRPKYATTYKMMSTDELGVLDPQHAERRLSTVPCTNCELHFALPKTVVVAVCPRCSQPSRHVELNADNESWPIHPEIKGMHRCFVGADGSRHYVVPWKYNRKIKHNDMKVWKVRQDFELQLLYGSLEAKHLCLVCSEGVAAPVSTPPPDADAIVGDLLSTLYLSTTKRCCFMCQTMHDVSQLTWFEVCPFRRQFVAPLDDGVYVCGTCLSSCSQCGSPALTELKPLCDTCHAARYVDMLIENEF